PAFTEGFQLFPLRQLVHGPIKKGVAVATALGIKLREDPWEMNKIGARTNHPPSMLYDIRHRQPTEVDYLGGAIAREAARLGVPAPLHTAMYQLIKGKEASWNFTAENKAEHA